MTKKLLLGVLVAALALPFAGAQATDHCDSPVNFLSGSALLLNPRSVGCDVIAEDFPETPGDDSNTDWITPGASQGIVRWLEAGVAPVDGTTNGDGSVSGSHVVTSWGGATALSFERGTGIDGQPASFYDSQEISVGRNNSLLGSVTITVCRDAEGTDCETVTYRGIAAV